MSEVLLPKQIVSYALAPYPTITNSGTDKPFACSTVLNIPAMINVNAANEIRLIQINPFNKNDVFLVKSSSSNINYGLLYDGKVAGVILPWRGGKSVKYQTFHCQDNKLIPDGFVTDVLSPGLVSNAATCFPEGSFACDTVINGLFRGPILGNSASQFNIDSSFIANAAAGCPTTDNFGSSTITPYYGFMPGVESGITAFDASLPSGTTPPLLSTDPNLFNLFQNTGLSCFVGYGMVAGLYGTAGQGYGTTLRVFRYSIDGLDYNNNPLPCNLNGPRISLSLIYERDLTDLLVYYGISKNPGNMGCGLLWSDGKGTMTVPCAKSGNVGLTFVIKFPGPVIQAIANTAANSETYSVAPVWHPIDAGTNKMASYWFGGAGSTGVYWTTSIVNIRASLTLPVRQTVNAINVIDTKNIININRKF